MRKKDFLLYILTVLDTNLCLTLSGFEKLLQIPYLWQFEEVYQSQILCIYILWNQQVLAFGHHFLIPQVDGQLQPERNLSRHWKPERNLSRHWKPLRKCVFLHDEVKVY